jgi:hypothetical protein
MDKNFKVCKYSSMRPYFDVTVLPQFDDTKPYKEQEFKVCLVNNDFYKEYTPKAKQD